MKTEKIVIVGGGSAGWMSASFLIKAFPHKEIVVVESPNIPRVGVGESTYDGIQRFIQFLEVDKSDFFKHTDASIKLAIKFSNFYSNTEDNDFIYPFGAPNTENTVWGLDDWHVKRFVNKGIDNKTYAETEVDLSKIEVFVDDDHSTSIMLEKDNAELSPPLKITFSKVYDYLQEKNKEMDDFNNTLKKLNNTLENLATSLNKVVNKVPT